MGVLYQTQYRRGTAAEWTAANPTLLAGEPGYETDTGKLKIGDGATAWATLAYFTGIVTIGTPNDGEVHLTPKTTPANVAGGPEGTMYYDSDDDHVWVATQ